MRFFVAIISFAMGMAWWRDHRVVRRPTGGSAGDRAMPLECVITKDGLLTHEKGSTEYKLFVWQHSRALRCSSTAEHIARMLVAITQDLGCCPAPS